MPHLHIPIFFTNNLLINLKPPKSFNLGKFTHTIKSVLHPQYSQMPFLHGNIIEQEVTSFWAPEIVDTDFIKKRYFKK